MSGALEGLRVGPWRTDSDTGYRAMSYVSCGTMAAMVYQGICEHAGKFQWAIAGPTAKLGKVRGGFALTVGFAEADAVTHLRSLGAVVVGEPRPLDTQSLRGLMESWLQRANSGDVALVDTLDRCANDLLKLIQAAEDDADDEILGVTARVRDSGFMAGRASAAARLREMAMAEMVNQATATTNANEVAYYHAARILTEAADEIEHGAAGG